MVQRCDLDMTKNNSNSRFYALISLCFLGVVLVLFFQSLDPSKVVISNDGPLGAINQAAVRMPSAFTGVWYGSDRRLARSEVKKRRPAV
jgi:hypothetical protein